MTIYELLDSLATKRNKKEARHLTTEGIPPVIPMSDIFVVCFIILSYKNLSTLFFIKILFINIEDLFIFYSSICPLLLFDAKKIFGKILKKVLTNGFG